VRKRLIVRGTGRLTGTVRYGELELERGGQIAGNISVLNSEGTGGSVGAARAEERSRSPLFGDTTASNHDATDE
jgi:cytoskeletal protein CcmA (bactofilin family)